jgi:competence protein ComEC
VERIKYAYTSDDFAEDIRRSPFVRVTLAFAGGIAAAYFTPLKFVSSVVPAAAILVALVVSAALHAAKGKGRIRYFSPHTGALYLWVFFFAGVCMARLQPSASALPLDEERYYRLLTAENPRYRTGRKYSTVDARVLAHSSDGKSWSRCGERAIVFFSGDASAILSPGDVFVCRTTFSSIPHPSNPDEFDFAAHMARIGIFAYSYVEAANATTVEQGRISFYKRFVLNIQRSVYEILRGAGLGKDEFGVMTALFTGNKEYLDSDLREAYAASGTVHLLAVSGLHVGIVYMVLQFLMRFAGGRRSAKIVKGIVTLIVLWIYAAVAGMAPSIARACTMFSIFVIGDVWGRRRNTYNNIALAAFVSCAANPGALFELGFQLSYAAVLGIVCFQPKFMQILSCRNRFANTVAEGASVTLAAQLGTLPIILFVFRSFPVYFLFANLIVVPLTSVLMYLGLTVAALSHSDFLLTAGGAALNFCVSITIRIVRFFSSLPGAVVEGIYIGKLQCLLLAVAILSLVFLMLSRRRMFANVLLVSLTGIFAIHALYRHETANSREFGLFRVNRAFYAYFIDRGQGFSVRDTASFGVSFDSKTRNYMTRRGFVSERDLEAFSLADSFPCSRSGLILFAGKRIALSSQLESAGKPPAAPLPVDYLMVTGSDGASPDELLACYAPQHIVVADNLPFGKRKKWLSLAAARRIPCRDIRGEGFWNCMIK